MASERLESKNDIASQDLHREGRTKLPSRADLQRFIAGHAAAAEAIWEEQRQRLEGLTVEQSRAEYDGLCEIWSIRSPWPTCWPCPSKRASPLS